jgi:hypothetical protein
MSETKYILSQFWQSKTGLQQTLYLGKYNGKIDCVDNKDDALIMTKEDAESWKQIVSRKHMLWNIEEIEIKQDVIEENNNDTI